MYCYDFGTTNKSFIRQHEYLKNKGISNNAFFLVLQNRELSGVDPYDPNLSVRQKKAILEECRTNYWYFIREIIRIPNMGTEARPYILHNGNLAFNFCAEYNMNIFFETPAVETGKTMSVLSRLLWEHIFVYSFTGYSATLMSRRHDDAKFNYEKFIQLYELLPAYIKNELKTNKIETLPTPITKAAIKSILVCLQSTRLYLDHFTFMKNNANFYKSILPHFTEIRVKGKYNSAPSGIIITTIPGDLSESPAQFAYEFEQDCCPFTNAFYDMPIQGLNKAIRDNSINGFMLIKYNYKDLELGEDWFNERCMMYMNNPATIKKELLLQWKLDDNENN